MIFDHLLWIIEPGYNNGITFLILHTFGRIVAPIFCFFIAEGAYYMHNRKKYLLRLFVFAIISHFVLHLVLISFRFQQEHFLIKQV